MQNVQACFEAYVSVTARNLRHDRTSVKELHLDYHDKARMPWGPWHYKAMTGFEKCLHATCLFECINCLLCGKVVLLFVTLLEKSASLSGLCPAVRSKMGELDGQSLQTGILCGSMDCRDDAHWRWQGHLHAGVFGNHEYVVVVNEDS